MDNLLKKASILITPTAYDTSVINAIKPQSSPFADLDFTRPTAGSNVGTANRENASGVIEQVAQNVPRIDYAGGTAHWLIEPLSTNLITYSEDFLNSSWQHNSSLNITANATTSPSGATNATRVELSGSGSRMGAEIALTSGNSYTLSFYAKNNGGTANLTATFDGQSADQAYTITNSFARYSFTFTATATETSQIRLFSGATDIDAFIWGAQFEELSYVTSYIPTSGSTVTRAEDGFGLNTTLDTSLINSTEGTFYAEMAALEDDGIDSAISLSDGTLNNTIWFRLRSGNVLQMKMQTQLGDTTTMNKTLSNYTNFFKVAVRFKTNDIALYVDGTEVDTELEHPTFSANTLTKIKSARGSDSDFFKGKIKCIAVFKEGLTDSELTCLTT